MKNFADRMRLILVRRQISKKLLELNTLVEEIVSLKRNGHGKTLFAKYLWEETFRIASELSQLQQKKHSLFIRS